MNALRIAALIAAPLLFAGCYSTPKEKTEYEKQIDALPMPVTEAERLEQCRTFKLAADRQQAEDFVQYALRSRWAPRIRNIPRLKFLEIASEP